MTIFDFSNQFIINIINHFRQDADPGSADLTNIAIGPSDFDYDLEESSQSPSMYSPHGSSAEENEGNTTDPVSHEEGSLNSSSQSEGHMCKICKKWRIFQQF